MLNTSEYCGKEVMNYVGYNDPYIFGPLVFKAYSNIVGLKIIKPCKGLNLLPGIPANFMAVFKRLRHGRNRDIQFPGNML